MGFQIEVSINYDSHNIISIRRQVNKNNPFEHFEVAGLSETTNWLDYPHTTQGDINMQDDSTSSMKEVNSLQPGTSSIVPVLERITPIANCCEKTNKRDLSYAMDT